MRNISQFAVSLVLLASQVHTPIFGSVTAAAESQAHTAGVYEVKLNTKTASPVEIDSKDKVDYDAEVLAPLHKAQAITKASKHVRAARPAVKAVAAVIIPTGDIWAALRLCEAGGNYTRNSGNGYYGAYQYNLGTWSNFMGYARPDLAPANVQDAKAHATQAARGWSPWPACARKIGAM